MVKPAIGSFFIEEDGSAAEYSHYNITSDISRVPLPFDKGDTTVSIEVSFNMDYGSDAPTEYVLFYQRYLEDPETGKKTVADQNVDNAQGTIRSTTQTIIVPDLLLDRIYVFSIYARKGTNFGKDSSFEYRTPSNSEDALSMSAQGIDVSSLTVGKSYLTITNSNQSMKKNKFQSFYRNFDALNTEENVEVGYTNVGSFSVESYTKAGAVADEPVCYSYGTSVYFDPSEDFPLQGAAFGFFVDSAGSGGYHLVIDTTKYSAAKDRKSIRVVKTGALTNVKDIRDSQTVSNKTLDGIVAGVEYKINIKVKVFKKKIIIKAYVNDFLITATDTTAMYDKTLNKIFQPTDTVSLTCRVGTAIFDYVYASEITEEEFNNSSYNPNFYDGQFSNDFLATSFGDLVYYSNSEADEYNKKKTSVDEFGTTVREIQKSDIRFDSRPSFPIYWSTGNTEGAKILGSNKTNFKGSSFVLNNTSTVLPLSDGGLASFYVLGNTLAEGGELVYTTDDLADYSAKEPVSFESNWLQSESDVKTFANWIKDTVINRGQIVKMTVFGNPLLSLGDIITINYPFQELNGEERFIITSIEHAYSGSLDTNIQCRALNKTAKKAIENTIVPAVVGNEEDVDNTSVIQVSPISEIAPDYTYWSAIPTPEPGGMNGSVFQFRKDNSLSPSDRIVVMANVDNKYYQLGSFSDYTSSIDFDSLPDQYVTDNGNIPGWKVVKITMFQARNSSRGGFVDQYITWSPGS